MGRVEDTEENAGKCICADCPSMSADGVGFFCTRGKSPNRVRRRGCLCGDCQIWTKYGLTRSYYCDEGVTE